MDMKNLNIKRVSVSLASKAITALFSISMLMTSCSEDNVINLKPINQIAEDEAFSTPSLILAAVNGVYNAAQRGDYAGGQRGYPFGAAFVQQGDNRGEDVVNTQTFYQLTYTATYDPGTANNVYYWSDTYRMINRANLVIEGVTRAVDNGIITQAVGDQYIAQAKFFRAAGHLELLFHFARPYNYTVDASHPGVPYRDFGINTKETMAQAMLVGRSSVAECYTKILSDLNDAENILGSGVITRVTKEAAIAFKTRVYLHMGRWNDVITEGNKLSGFTLTSDPNEPFISGYKNTESIFSLENSATNNPGVNAALASQYKRRTLVAISPIIWRDPSWLPDDKRRRELPHSDATDVQDDAMVFTIDGAKYTNKYKDGRDYTDPSPIIRYAEVVLSMAEAHARKASPDFLRL